MSNPVLNHESDLELNSYPSLDERVDDFCFILALALRRILGIEPLDASSEDDEEDEAKVM